MMWLIRLNIFLLCDSLDWIHFYYVTHEIEYIFIMWHTLGVTTAFTVGFTSAAGGVMTLSLGSTETRNLKPGRYVYDVLVSSGNTVYNIVNGNVLVKAGIATAPYIGKK